MSLTTRLVAPISSDDRRELAAAILQLLRDAVATFQYTVFAYETGPRLRTHSVVDLDARRFYALGGNQRILATAASRAPSRLTLYQQAPEDIEQHVYSLACYRQPRICDRIALISRQRDEVWLSVNSYHDSGRERFQPGEIARIEALAVKRN
ncbi:MAG: hypothetical protein HIU89_07130 [Proteobacteria bacterium]|nr:hypothetical protein [Pseudomonadota bacterium]